MNIEVARLVKLTRYSTQVLNSEHGFVWVKADALESVVDKGRFRTITCLSGFCYDIVEPIDRILSLMLGTVEDGISPKGE